MLYFLARFVIAIATRVKLFNNRFPSVNLLLLLLQDMAWLCLQNISKTKCYMATMFDIHIKYTEVPVYFVGFTVYYSLPQSAKSRFC